MTEADELRNLEGEYASVATALFSEKTVQRTLHKIVHTAERAIDSCDAAGIFVAQPDGPRTAAASQPLVDVVDRMQIETQEGPCLDSATHGQTVYVEDLSGDPRWPDFAPKAIGAGVLSVLAYSLSADRHCALSLYAHRAAAFGAVDRAQGVLFATLAHLALDAAEVRADDELKMVELRRALDARGMIGKAQGILMQREQISSEAAFAILRRASQQTNTKLRIVAENLVQTCEAPAPERLS